MRLALAIAVFAACSTSGKTTAPLSTPAPAAPADAAPADAPPAPVTATTLHCFQWVHGADFSTDCYRGRDACERERQEMIHGARDAAPCAPIERGSCTIIARPGEASPPEERCFGNANNCERYRAFVLGNRFTATACADAR